MSTKALQLYYSAHNYNYKGSKQLNYKKIKC